MPDPIKRTILQVVNWNIHFERAETRRYSKRNYLVLPLDHGGDGYGHIALRKDGPQIMWAFVAMLEVLAGQEWPRFGFMTIGGMPWHNPVTSTMLAAKTHYRKAIFDTMLAVTAAPEVAWLRHVDVDIEQSADNRLKCCILCHEIDKSAQVQAVFDVNKLDERRDSTMGIDHSDHGLHTWQLCSEPVVTMLAGRSYHDRARVRSSAVEQKGSNRSEGEGEHTHTARDAATQAKDTLPRRGLVLDPDAVALHIVRNRPPCPVAFARAVVDDWITSFDALGRWGTVRDPYSYALMRFDRVKDDARFEAFKAGMDKAAGVRHEERPRATLVLKLCTVCRNWQCAPGEDYCTCPEFSGKDFAEQVPYRDARHLSFVVNEGTAADEIGAAAVHRLQINDKAAAAGRVATAPAVDSAAAPQPPSAAALRPPRLSGEPSATTSSNAPGHFRPGAQRRDVK
jgi:hypothetical protein